MKCTQLPIVFLLILFSSRIHAHNISESNTTNAIYEANQDISWRYHAQWSVDEETQKKVHKTYGSIRFDEKGNPILPGLSAEEKEYWLMHFNHCMGDGCYYCDAGEGSCELQTCGENNEHCKPYLNKDGQPACGSECADYALMQLCQL